MLLNSIEMFVAEKCQVEISSHSYFCFRSIQNEFNDVRRYFLSVIFHYSSFIITFTQKKDQSIDRKYF